MNGEEKEAYFKAWAQKRARALGVNGITVLISRDPTYLYVNVAQEAKPVFDRAAEERLRELLLARFRGRKYDEGLLAAVKLVGDKLAEQRP
jgi:hypothetical protein